MKKKILLNCLSCAMIFGWTGKSIAYDYFVLGAEIVTTVAAATLASGAYYQYSSTQQDENNYPPPGKKVNVGGFSLHINCTGSIKEGQPTVILDAGLGGSSLDWHKVQPDVAKFARVCSFDRAGYGWSDQSPNPRTSKYIAKELDTLLVNAGEEGPFILVGHSLGGINVRMFANKYPEKVAGIVLVDASHEDQYSKLPKAPAQSWTEWLLNYQRVLDYPRLATFFANVGAVRFIQRGSSFDDLPNEIRNSYRAKRNTSNFIWALTWEDVKFKDSLAELKHVDSSLGDTPLIVITAGKSLSQEGKPRDFVEWEQKMKESWEALQKDLATKSTNSRQVFAENSGHGIPYEQPEIIVYELKRFFR